MCVAGIGASAGGFNAIREFFQAMPSDSGIAFVIVQHLAPSHVSMAAEIFSKFTSMPVCEATDGMPLEANHVYTSPSDKDLTLAQGCLRLTPRNGLTRIRLPIDNFFNTLGLECAARAIGIVFSGTGSDGAIGLKTIAAHGGVVLVQKPETAEYDGMPRSAISTGVVNYVLPVAQMPKVISSYAHHPYIDSIDPGDLPAEKSSTLKQLIHLIKVRRDYDFTGYKHGTLVRRIERRMGLHGLLKQEDYVAFLKANPDEVDALFRDLLIGVTEFFRDPEAWKELESAVIAPLVASKDKDDAIRIWVPGCSTGEEAYTMAMVVQDRVRRARKNCQVQIFATDTNNDALEIGRVGHYPGGISSRIESKLLHRYFTTGPDPLPCVVSDELRKLVVFGTQNLFADPPFGRVDLISCRNVLIYLEPEVQKRVLNIFHFALSKEGSLFLGSAESNGGRDDLFKPLSKKYRIFQRQGYTRVEMLPPPLPLVDSRSVGVLAGGPPVPRLSQVASVAQRLIMDRFAPAAVLVNEHHQALYFCGPTDEFLMRPRGAPTHDLLLMVREGLRARLRMALNEASISKLPVTVDGARMKRAGAFVPVQVNVVPSGDSDAGSLYLVVFLVENLPTLLPPGDNADAALLIHLEQELAVTRADLQNTVEKFETSTENLRISNEEVVSTNEELRSLNEELESSKEELQSLNEELTTVNQQLEVKVRELEASNSDLQNLLTSSDIATICLDEALRIKWFTPATQTQFNFLATDIGRPIANMVSAIGDLDMPVAARAVLSQQGILDYEFQTPNGRWYLRKILPYEDADKKMTGIIVTYTDVTDSYLANEAAQLARADLVQSVSRDNQMRMMSMAMVSAEEHERRSLAQDLHDDLGQWLTVVSLKIAALEKQKLSPPAHRTVAECSKSIEQVHRKLRSMAMQLSPPILDYMGLVPAMKSLADEVYGLYKLEITIEDDGKPKPLESAVSVTVYRAIRELLINVAKHAGVSHAEVRFSCVDNNFMLVRVSDAGAGFNAAAVFPRSSKGGFGLLNVRERIGFLGGEVSLNSVEGDGTSVTLKIPLETRAEVPG